MKQIFFTFSTDSSNYIPSCILIDANKIDLNSILYLKWSEILINYELLSWQLGLFTKQMPFLPILDFRTYT